MHKIIIDLSSYQGNLTESMIKKINPDYGIIKLTESTNYSNPYNTLEYKRLTDCGVKGVGFYHFGRFTNSVRALMEARFFANSMSSKEHLMILDAEITGMSTSSVITFLKYLKKKGYKTGFYTYKYLLPQFDLSKIKPYMDFFWLAAYPLGDRAANKNPDFHYFPSANYVDAWQFTDNLLGYHVDGSITVTNRGEKLLNAGKVVNKKKKSSKKSTDGWTDALGDKWIKKSGYYTLKGNRWLRWGAKRSSTKIAFLRKGQVIKYDAISKHDGYTWLRQPRTNGFGYIIK